MCERDCCYKNFNVTTSVKLSKSAEAQKECKCQTNFYIKQQQLKQQQLQQMQSQQHTLTTTTTNANMHPQQQQQQQQQRIHHMQMSGQNNNNGSNISPTSSHTSNTNVTPSSSSSPAGSHYSSSDNGCSTASSSPTPSATSSKAPPSIGVNLRVTGQCSQGGRKYMEDYFSVAYQQSENAKDLEYAFIGIYDGHGGAEAAIFAKEHLMMEIINQKLFWSDSDKDVLRAIREGYIATHYAMWRAQENWPKTANGLPSTAGTTATVAFIRREKIYIGHVGDSGIVLGYQNENENFWRSKQLTTDHKPESIQERKRIIRSGGKVVVKSGVPRVVWNRPRHAGHRGPIRCDTIVDEIPFLAVARSLGDLWSYNASRNEFVVSPDPDVKVIKINPKTFRCLIFGTDGLWNVVSPQEATDTVFEKENINQHLQAQRGDSLAEGSNGQWTNPSKGLVEKALKTWSSKKMRADNTSVVTVILYPPGSSGDETPPPPPVATTNPPMAHNNALQYEQATMHADILAQQLSYNDIKTYHEIADKYLPPEEYRNFNYYQEDEDLLEAESEEQPEEDPLLLHHQQHTSYTIQANESTASTGESFWSAQTASEHLYAAHATRQDSTSWHWEDVCANVIDPTALPVGMAAVEVPVVELSSGLTTLVGVAEEDAEADEESSTDEEEEEDEVDEDIEGDNDEEDSVSDYETDDAEKNYDWGIVLSTKNKRNSKLNKLSALTHAQHAVELKTAATHLTNTTADTSYAHFIATAVDNANPAPTPLPPTYLNSFAESYNSLLSTQITSQETVNGNAVDAASPSSSNSNPASSSYQSLSGSSMHEILQEQQRYQQQCMSEEDGYSLTKLETRRATASGGGGVQTFKIFQQQQQEEHAATASYHTPIASLTNTTSGGGGGTTAEIWQQRFPSIAAAYARCLPHMTTSTPTPVTVKPLELDALLQQEREEEQQVALEQLERQRKLADELAGVSASSDDDDEPIIEEYLDEELEEIAKIAKIAVQINEISSSSADETSAGAKETTPKTPESMLIDADLAVPLSNTASDDVLPNERLERIEILQAKPDVVQVAAAVQASIPHAVIKPAQQSPYAALYKSQASTTKRSLTRHKAAAAHQYPNIPNENQHLSITASSHALCTKRAYASSSSSTSTPNNGGSRSLSTSRSASTLDKRQLRSTAGACIDYSKRTLRTRNSLAKDMKAKTTLASTLKRTAGTTSQFLRTTAVNLLGVAGANSSPSCSRSSSSIAVGSSNQNGNRKTTKPERLAAAAAAFSAAAAHTHAINLRSRQINGQLTATAKSAANNTSASSLHTPAYRRERRNLRSLAAASAASSKKESSSGPTNFSKSTRLQSSAGNALAAPPPSPKLINAVAAVAAATRARSLLAKTAAAMSAAAASLSTSSPSAAGGGGSSSAATAAGVYSKRLSLRSGASSAASAAAVCAALRSRATRKIKR